MKTLHPYLLLLLASMALPVHSMQKQASDQALTQEQNAAFSRIKNQAYRLGDLVLKMSKQTLASKTKEIHLFNAQEAFATAALALPNSLLTIKTALKNFCIAVDTYGKTPYGGPEFAKAVRAVTATLRTLKDTFVQVEKAQNFAVQAAQVINQRNGVVAPAALPATSIAVAADAAVARVVAKPVSTDIAKKVIAINPLKRAAFAMGLLTTPLAVAGVMSAYDAGYINQGALSAAANAVATSATSMISSVWNSFRNFGTTTANAVNAVTPAPTAVSEVASQIATTGATAAVLPATTAMVSNAAVQAANADLTNAFNSFNIFTNHAK